jgi:hypothetical protein
MLRAVFFIGFVPKQNKKQTKDKAKERREIVENFLLYIDSKGLYCKCAPYENRSISKNRLTKRFASESRYKCVL